MPTIALEHVLSPFVTLPKWPSIFITSITNQSADAEPGALFLAYKNDLCDRVAFMDEAIEKGAVAVAIDTHRSDIATLQERYSNIALIEIPNLAHCCGEIASRFYGDPTKDMLVIGVTGTNGKSSTAYFTSQALNAFHVPCAFVGTIGVGLPDHLQASPLTTQDPITFQKIAADFKQQGIRAICIEMSSHALSQDRLNGVPVHTSVLTQITSDHLDYHHTLDNYKAAKEKCMQLPNLQMAVLNLDDLEGMRWLRKYHDKLSIIGYGSQALLDEDFNRLKGYLWTQTIDNDEAGLHIVFKWMSHGTEQTFDMASPIMGRFNAENIAATVSVLLGHGYAIDAIQKAIALLKAAPGRMQRFGGAGLPTVYVDFAHTTDALKKALESVKEHTSQPLTTIFGCGGDRDKTKRAPMGRVVAQFSDAVILTNDNPRNEDPMQIALEVKAGLLDENFNMNYLSIELDREKAITESILKASPTDVFLIAGKGHETKQFMQGYSIECDDRAIVERTLKAYQRGKI